MKKNMGSIDRIARLTIAAVLVILALTNVITGAVSFIVLALAAVFVLTSIIGFCPLYTICGLNSCRVKA